MSRNHPNVLYHQITKGKPRTLVKNVCFSALGRLNGSWSEEIPLPDYVRYGAPIDAALNKTDVESFVKFLYLMFGSRARSVFRHRLDWKAKRLYWVLRTKDMKRITALLYLTAFRYVDEFAEIVKDMAPIATSDKTDDQKFATFQMLHDTYTKNGVCWNLGGHGLIYTVKDGKTIDLETFWQNLRAVKASVHNHFEPQKA